MKISEDTIQKQFMECATQFSGQVPEFQWFFHVPNGGTRHVREAVKFKAMGVKPGVPDILLPIPKPPFNGLAIEFKAGKNKSTEQQLIWQDFLRKQQWYVTICYTWEDAICAALLYCNKNPHDFSIYIDQTKFNDMRGA
jgi:hypothetical protein